MSNKVKCIILQVVNNPNIQLGETYKKHLNEFISYPVSKIEGCSEKTIEELEINEVISINLSHIGARKVNVQAQVINNTIHEMKPKVIIVIIFVLSFSIY